MTSHPISIDEAFEALEKFNEYFGFCRLYRCCLRWAVSNKTDEGIGGCGPTIAVEGASPKEAIIATAEFLRNPQIPTSIPCPKCGEAMGLHEYRPNSYSKRMSLEFYCGKCWDIYMADDICPDCFGNLEIITEPDQDPRNPAPLWDAKCEKCGKVFLRGDIDQEDKMTFPNWKFELLDLEAIGADDEG